MRVLRGDGAPVLITGGAGFVGCNLAAAFAAAGRRVRVLDDLSRPGVERNAAWLAEHWGERLELAQESLGTTARLAQVLEDVAAVYHFAAQVAVTTSFERPLLDFASNLEGTFRLLEAVRGSRHRPHVIFASTNKVYGDLAGLPLEEGEWRYAAPAGTAIDESQPLSFHTPYGCSKGAADQYVLDYAASFGLSATVLRMSCMYGPRQFGTEDQGWVAHFLRRALAGEPIDIYGNGKQVRDILFVDDLVRAQQAALGRMAALSGRPWNLGGGMPCAVSLLEVLGLIETATGTRPAVRFHPPRAGDQRWYVSDHGAFTRVTGWRPRVRPAEGIRRLHAWLAGDPARALLPADVRPAMGEP
ncbi:MAG: NAD-dependent epimerase/dehydratase family protein [Pseudomonadota bacterium]